jgi:hypothetical protein
MHFANCVTRPVGTHAELVKLSAKNRGIHSLPLRPWPPSAASYWMGDRRRHMHYYDAMKPVSSFDPGASERRFSSAKGLESSITRAAARGDSIVARVEVDK